MDTKEMRRTAETMWTALEEGDWDTAADQMHDDYVQEWPQSGERIVGGENATAINENYPGGVPRMTIRRTLAGGDLVVLEVGLEYADGSVYQAVSILEFKEGKVLRETDYFARPFEAPEWRAQWVERM